MIVKDRNSIFLFSNKLNKSLTELFIISGTWLIQPVDPLPKAKKFKTSTLS